MDYRLPIAVRAAQNAENTEALLRKKTLQIGLNEKDLTKLSGGSLILDYGKELSGRIRTMIRTFLRHCASACRKSVRWYKS